MSKPKSVSARVSAGFGSWDITPPLGTHLAGDAMGVYRPAQTVKNPLYAKASVFQSGGKTICIIGMDVIIVTEPYSNYIKDKITAEFDIDRDAIMVFAIQSHSAPSVGGLMLDEEYPLQFPPDKEFISGTSTPYSQAASDGAVEAARVAFANVRPLSMEVKSGLVHGQAFCRRAVTKNGGMLMPFPPGNTRLRNPFGPDDILYIEGPADDEVGVACFRDDEMNLISALLHFTCHPVNLFCTPHTRSAISPDWPGTWSEQLQAMTGMDVIPTVLNGCCGNINPMNPFEQDQVLDVDEMGAALEEMAEKLIYSMKFDGTQDAVIDYKTFAVPCEYRDIPQERLDEVERLLDCDGYRAEPDGSANQDWFLAASTKSIEYTKKREPLFQYVVQVFRIGDLAVVSMPGEPFTEGQLSIKLRSDAAFTYVTHCATKYCGYIATRDAFKFDGHETNYKYTFWAKLKEDSLEKISDRIVEEINAMFAK